MSTPTRPTPPKSNTGLIVLIVALVLVALAVPALCICGGAGFWFFKAREADAPPSASEDRESAPTSGKSVAPPAGDKGKDDRP